MRNQDDLRLGQELVSTSVNIAEMPCNHTVEFTIINPALVGLLLQLGSLYGKSIHAGTANVTEIRLMYIFSLRDLGLLFRIATVPKI